MSKQDSRTDAKATAQLGPLFPEAVPSTVGSNQWSGRSRKGATWTVYRGDALDVLKSLPPDHYAAIVTSPPYFWQRDYGVDGQIGMEGAVKDYVSVLTKCFDEVKRVLKKDGLLFLNLGDTYYSAKGEPKGRDRKNKGRRFGLRLVDQSGLGLPRKTLIGIPWQIALSMIARGWALRSTVIWHRKGAMPEPTAHDRPWRTYEFVFVFSRSPKYYFDRTKLEGSEDVWTISDRPQGNKGIHSAAFPSALVERCLTIGCRPGGLVLDPFAGTGTTLAAALSLGHSCVGIDLNAEYCQFMADRLSRL